jgi:hypothetical protein
MPGADSALVHLFDHLQSCFSSSVMVTVCYETKINQCEISDSHRGVAEDSRQTCDSLSLGEQFPLFPWSFRNYTFSEAAVHPRRHVSSVINC